MIKLLSFDNLFPLLRHSRANWSANDDGYHVFPPKRRWFTLELLTQQAARKKKTEYSRTYDLLATSPDTLPLSYRRLVGAKATKVDRTSYIREVKIHV